MKGDWQLFSVSLQRSELRFCRRLSRPSGASFNSLGFRAPHQVPGILHLRVFGRRHWAARQCLVCFPSLSIIGTFVGQRQNCIELCELIVGIAAVVSGPSTLSSTIVAVKRLACRAAGCRRRRSNHLRLGHGRGGLRVGHGQALAV